MSVEVYAATPCDHTRCLMAYQMQVMLESSVCQLHGQTSRPDYLDAMDMSNLPHVVIQLRTFSAQVHSLLQSHDGSVPLSRLVFILKHGNCSIPLVRSVF